MNWRQVRLALAAGLGLWASGSLLAQENSAAGEGAVAIAGFTPFDRPEGAPALAEFKQTDAWRANALRGIPEPLPPGLKFIDSQGAWYTPFDHPGMLRPYDLRGLHGKAAP